MQDPYEILGIEKDADQKTIKRAYAKLVKQYHPEEQPEEWKRIHDAYELAMKNASEHKQEAAVALGETDYSQQLDRAVETAERQERDLTKLVNIPQPKEAPSTPIGNDELNPDKSAEIHRMSENDADDIFNEMEEMADKQREEEEKALESAVNEIRQLAWDNRFHKKEWAEFFEREDLLPMISRKEFLKELGDCFEYNQIDLTLYLYMNKKLGIVAEYVKSHNADMARGRDLAAVQYAGEKVRIAHKRYREEHVEKHLEKWAWVFILAFLLLFVITLLLSGQAGQRKEEQSERQGVTTEWQDELMRQQEIYILE